MAQQVNAAAGALLPFSLLLNFGTAEGRMAAYEPDSTNRC